jgi:hypothetical protein
MPRRAPDSHVALCESGIRTHVALTTKSKSDLVALYEIPPLPAGNVRIPNFHWAFGFAKLANHVRIVAWQADAPNGDYYVEGYRDCAAIAI